MKTSKSILLTVLVGIITIRTFAQEGFPVAEPGSAATNDPSKTTVVSNGIEMVRQFELRPEAASKSGPAKLNPVTSDYELEIYKEDIDGWVKQQGQSHNLRVSYGRSSGDEKYKITGSFSERIIVPKPLMNGETKHALFNHLLSVKGRRRFLQTDDFVLGSGIGADMVIYSKKITDMLNYMGDNVSPIGGIFSLDVVAEKYFSSQKVIGGVILQQNMFNKTQSTDLGAAVLYGLPAGTRLTLNIYASYRLTLMTFKKIPEYDMMSGTYTDGSYKRFDYSQDGISTPHSLTIGAGSIIKISDSFGLNIGYRILLLAEYYSSNTFTVGGRFAF
ncbi:MAG: hypothetical protein JW915_21000 [Chitinispirillaceae bacterium]|nr:hypothetical protein [Chitinispirillaceae bacterium]